MSPFPDLNGEVGPRRNDEHRSVVAPLAVGHLMPRLAERHPQQRALMVVAAKAEIASTLVSELQHDRADVAEGKTPLGGLDAVAREPEIGTAHCLAPGVEVIECQHAAVPPCQTRHGSAPHFVRACIASRPTDLA